MEMRELREIKQKVEDFKRPSWSGKEEGKKIRFENYRTETIKRIEMIIDMRIKCEKYLQDIDDYYLQIMKLCGVDFLEKFAKPIEKEPEPERKSPLLPI